MNRLWKIFAAVALVATLVSGVGGLAGAEPNEGSTPVSLDDQRRISAGGLHTCAVLDTGEVQCWGGNANGQLGNDSTTASTVPRKVVGITTALGVSAGSTHACALIHDGTVRCWGNNGSGQLGDNSTTSTDSPVEVFGLSDAVGIAAGGFHTCALRAGGTVVCWGNDGSGQLGDGGGTGTSYVPITVNVDTDPDAAVEALAPLTGVTAVTSGEYHACALVGATGKVRCWGHNGFGQLGNGATLPSTQATSAVEVVGIPDDDSHAHAPHKAVAVSAGQSHTCAVLDDNSVRCWGHDFYGQLGDDAHGAGTDKSTPVTVQFDSDSHPTFEDPDPLTGVVAITTGQFHTCARRADNTARCWGNNGRGQLGDGSDDDRDMAVPVTGLSDAVAVTAGAFHTCALTTVNSMKCWGYNFYGQLGGYAASRVTPDAVTALTAASFVTAGDGHACALVTTAEVPPTDQPVCWGNNANGELGAGLTVATAANSTIPVPVSGIVDADAISAGNGYACALPAGSGTPKCWGRNTQGQLGNGTTTSANAPVTVSGLTTASQIAAGGELDPISGTEIGHTCALRADGRVRCWGANAFGQLGDGTTTNSSTPVAVSSDHDDDHLNTPPPSLTAPIELTGATAIGVGGRHACALVGGSVRCWGRNFDGQLGDGTTTDRAYGVTADTDAEEPDPDESEDKHFDPLTGVTAITAGARHTCALKNDNTVWCWGRNADGQLGDDTTTARDHPVKVKDLPVGFTVLDITAGDNHTCARVNSTISYKNNTALCWGDNSAGQLGVSGGDRTDPTEPEKLGEPDDSDVQNVDLVKNISGGRSNTCAALIETTVYCSGDNLSGQLGDGIGPQRTSPIPVQSLGSVGANSIPAPVDDTATTAPGDAVVVDVKANDTDADGHALTVNGIPDAPERGTATTDGSTVTYSPNANFCTVDPTSNVDTFQYTVTDGIATVPAFVTVTVLCPNTAPTVADDAAITNEETAVVVDVLANDSDVNGDTVTVSSVTDPPNGATAIDANKVKYTPDADFFGTDTFTYKASDGTADSAPATVTITVKNVNDAPVAVDDNATTAEDTAVTIDVTANDTDVDGPSKAVVAANDPPHGSVQTTSPSSIKYTPDAGYCGTDGFSYTVSDGNKTDNGTVNITISCTNDGPNAVDDAATTSEDVAVVIDVLANDTDPEGDTLTISGISPMPSDGTAVVESGKIKYTPAQDFCGADTFGYTASDGSDTDSAVVVPVVVLCVNDAPVANDDSRTTGEDTPADLEVLLNDTDPDGNALKVVGASDPAHGTAVVRSTNLVSYKGDADFCGTDTFTYTMTDGYGESDEATVIMTVSCVNDAPVVATVGAQSLPWGEDLSVPLSASDADSGDSAVFSLVSGPAGASVAGGSMTWTPSSSQVGTHAITVRGTDSSGATDDETFSVSVDKRATSVTYAGASSGQYSDPVAVGATLVDFEGAPVGGRVVSFTIGSRSGAGMTDGAGQSVATIVPADAAGSSSVGSSFAGDGAYLPSSVVNPFTIGKESVSTTFTGAHVTHTSGSSAAVQLSARVAEEADGSLGMGTAALQVTFTQVGGGVLCTSPVSGAGPGQGVATCATSALGLGSRAVVAKVTSTKFDGPVEVGAFSVAQAVTGSASGGGRVGSVDAFAFQAKPGGRKAPPVGDALHVRRVGGVAIVDHTSTLTALTAGCSGGKTKVCSAVVEGSSATRWQVDLADGTVTALGGTPSMRIDATDAIEPDGTGGDRYAVGIGVPDSYFLGSPSAQSVLSAGNIRVIP